MQQCLDMKDKEHLTSEVLEATCEKQLRCVSSVIHHSCKMQFLHTDSSFGNVTWATKESILKNSLQAVPKIVRLVAGF